MIKMIFGFLLMFSVTANAGIRGVLGGGGYAEMLTLSMFNQMHSILFPFENTELKDKLSLDERVLLNQALNFSDWNQVEVEFAPTHESDRIRYEKVAGAKVKIIIPRSMIYDKDGQPVAYQQIFMVVMRAWVGMERKSADVGERLTKAIVADSNLRISAELIEFDNPALKIRGVTLPAAKLGGQRVNLFVEFQEATVDATEMLRETLKCSGDVLPVLTALHDLRAIRDIMVAQVKWRCGKEGFAAQMAARLKPDMNSENFQSLLKLQLSAIRPYDDCEAVLE